MKFKTEIKKRLAEKLPAEKAHASVMSYQRKSAEQIIKEKADVRTSAVLCLIEPTADSWCIYLMERKVYGGVHSGQISFAGGKTEPGDKSHQHTALRETHEELGVHPNNVEILGELSTIYIPPSNFLVYPFVGFALQKLIITPSPDEVESVLRATPQDLLKATSVKRSAVKMSGSEARIKVNHYTVNGHVVWGATAMILSELVFILKEIGMDENGNFK